MKVLLFNGSTRNNGCTYLALDQVAQTLRQAGIETELLQLGGKPVRDCLGCNRCAENGQCVFSEDVVNLWIRKARQADGFVFGSPVYFAHPTGQMLAVMDRLFYAGGDAFAHKPAAAVVTARRAGTTASLDVLTKHFTNAQMPVVSSTYWNMVFGPAPEQVVLDQEACKPCGTWGETSPGSSNASRQDGSKVFCPRKLSTAINPSACAGSEGPPLPFFPPCNGVCTAFRGTACSVFSGAPKGLPPHWMPFRHIQECNMSILHRSAFFIS